jgi:membrane protein YdbS with pleckstrin-like domain
VERIDRMDQHSSFPPPVPRKRPNKWRYVFPFALGWGTIMAVVIHLLRVYAWHDSSNLTIALVVFLATGVILGLIIWRITFKPDDAAKEHYDSEDQSSMTSS